MTTATLRAVGAGSLNQDDPTTIADYTTGYFPTGEFIAGQMNRGWLIFDIFHIPSDAVVSSAVLTLTVDSNFLGNSHTLSAYRLRRRGWYGLEDTSGTTGGRPQTKASWNNYRQDLGSAWTTAGAGSTTNDRYSPAMGTSATLTSSTSGTVSITLDNTQVQEWLSGAVVNNGLLLQASDESASSNTLIRWKPIDDATASNRPTLTISYTSATEALDITDGIVAFYNLSDTSDASGNGHTLTNVNGTTFVSGKIGNAAHFSAASNQRLTNNDAALKPGASQDWTLVLQAKLTDVSDLYTAVSQWNAAPGGTSGGGWRVFYHDIDTGIPNYVAQLNDATGAAEVADVVGYTSGAISSGGTYIMVAVRHDAARKVFHIGFNDQMAKANAGGGSATGDQWGPYTATYIPVTDPFIIGAQSDGSGGIGLPYNGDIDALGFWDRWLTDAEISTTLYNGGTGLEPTFGGGGGGSAIAAIQQAYRARRAL